MIQVPIGIVGGGFGALLLYVTLRFRGVPAADIVVLAPQASPVATWQRAAAAIRQRAMRSESVAHFYPTDSPGLATVEAVRTGSFNPIVRSWFDRYHPTVDFFVEHMMRVARQVGFFTSYHKARVGDVEQITGGFRLWSETGQILAETQHVVLAVGHGELATPDVVQRFREHNPDDKRVVSAFAPKEYQPHEVVLVIGDGLTGGTEWMNVLEHGGSVIGVSQRGFTFNQALNTPRKYFSKRGIIPYQNKPQAERAEELHQATVGTLPTYEYWKRMYRLARADGSLQLIQGNLVSIEPSEDSMLHCRVESSGDQEPNLFCVDRVIYATGFAPVTTHPLLQKLIDRHQLPVVGSKLDIDERFCVRELSGPDSCLAVMGAAASWALPCADSVGGMKISARKISNTILGPESWHPVELWRKMSNWTRLLVGGRLL